MNTFYGARGLLPGELPWQFGKFAFGRMRIRKARDKAKVSRGRSRLLPETLGIRATESVPVQKEEKRGKEYKLASVLPFRKHF